MHLDTGYDYTWNIRAFVNYDGDYPEMEKDVIGTMIYRNGELITAEPIDATTFTDNGFGEYSVRVVHGGLPNVSYYAMSCETTVVSVEENQIDNSSIYPNPVSDNLNIAVEGMKRITLTNAIGQVVLDRTADSDNEIVDMSQYESGVYMVRITTTDGVVVKRITIVK